MANFDERCRDLAEYFLHDEPTLRTRADELAALLQHTIETWICCEREGANAQADTEKPR